MVMVEDMTISGDIVDSFKNKVFSVAEAPSYQEFQQDGDTVRKVVMKVIMQVDRSIFTYFPNKTSLKIMTGLQGAEMDNWVGKMFEFETSKTKIAGKDTTVLYVKAKRVEAEVKDDKK